MQRRIGRALGTVLLLAVIALILATPAAGAAPGAGEEKAVNINTAGVEELMTLPGIGKAYAERIVEYRQKNGPFKKVEDLLNVRGIGDKTFDRIKTRLTVGKG
jgi:competence protein ComEA